MAASPLVVVLVVAALAIALAIRALSATRGDRTDLAEAPSSEAARAAHRHATRVRRVAWATLVATGWATLQVTGAMAGLAQGRLLGLAPIAAGIAFVLVHAIGDLTWPRPTGAVRRASLARRTVTDVTPAPAYRLTVAWGVALTVTLVACGAVSGNGRDIARAYDGGTSGAGPFPGWFYGAPLLLAALVLLAAVHGLVVLVARRAAVAGAPDRWDLELRRHSARAVLGGAQLVLGLTLAAVLMVAGSAVRSVGSSTGSTISGELVDTGDPLYTSIGISLVVLALAIALISLVVAMRTPHAARTPALAPA